MEYKLVFVVCAVLFGATMSMGGLMATRLFRRNELPKPLVVSHGATGWTTLAIFLFMSALSPPNIWIQISVGFFVLALILGLGLLVFHILGKKHPTWMIVLHAGTAVVGMGLLVTGLVV